MLSFFFPYHFVISNVLADSDVGRQSYVQEAFMQQILSAQKPTHLSHPGERQ